jgi:hypothetical protein
LRVILSFSPKLSSFCRHYGCALPPCLPRTPEHKGKTENEIRHLKGNALRGRTFSSLSGENEFLGHWEKTVADVLIHGTTRKQVATLFAQEQKALLPLPPDLFPCFQEGRRTVHRDSYVEVDKAYYTVPPELEQRLKEKGQTWEWAEVLPGLDNLHEVEDGPEGVA